MVPLTGPQDRALAALRTAWPDADFVLLGALALGRHIPMDYRTTDDLDLAVAVSMDDFPGPLRQLAGWRRHDEVEHRFFSPDGQMVDVLPAGPTLIEHGSIEWSSGHRMSLAGFDLAFEHCTEESAGETTIQVPSAPVIAFLKMRAWLDRPPERQKDILDLAHLLLGYVGDVDDARRWTDDVTGLGLDYEEVSPFVLGRDLQRIMTGAHRPHVDEFLAKASPELFAARGVAIGWSSADRAEQLLGAFRRGLDHGEES